MNRDQQIERLRKKGFEDHYFFCQKILGYTKVRSRPHKELTDFLINSDRRTSLVLMPRGSFKSTYVTQGYVMWKILSNPNIRVLISSETQRNAIRFVNEIRQQFETNARFRGLYGDWTCKGNWKTNEFTVGKRTDIKREPTVTAGSLEKGTQVGQHYDLVVLDDVVSQNNINSPEQVQKTIDHYKLLLSILEPGGKIIVIGTRWGHWELYAWLHDPDGPEYSQMDRFFRQAEDDDGNLLMPEVLGREFLDQQRKTQGARIYAFQYLNRAESDEFSTFSAATIKQYTENPPGLIYFMTVDPAISLHARSDYTGIIVNGVDYYGRWFLQEALQVKMEPSELINFIFELHAKYNLMCLGMEKFALEKVLLAALNKEMEKRKIWIPIKQLTTNTRKSKEARIQALQPKFEAGEIFLKPDQKELYMQIVNHPSLKHDDILDALESQLHITFPSDFKPETKEESKLSANEKKMWKEVKELTRKRVKELDSYEI